MNEINSLCEQIREVGHSITIITKNGVIYVYLNEKMAFSTNANNLGVNNIVIYLMGVMQGMLIQTVRISKIKKEKV